MLFLTAPTREDLIARLRSLVGDDPARLAPALAREPVRGAHRLVVLAANAAEWRERAGAAASVLADAPKSRVNLSNTIFYGDLDAEPPMAGGVAVLFPGFGARDLSLFDALDARASLATSIARVVPAPRQARGDGDESWRHLDGILRVDLAAWTVLERLGITATALVGHSLGEQAALIASGRVRDLPAVARVLARIAVECAAPASDARSLGMIAVTAASRALLDARIAAQPTELAIALDNCPQQTVVWGTAPALAALSADVRGRGELVFAISDLTLPVHTPFFPMSAASLADAFALLPLAAPRRDGATLPIMWSAATAAPLSDDPADTRATVAAGWRQPVRFRETLLHLHDAGVRTFIEAGPGGRLAGFTRDTLRGRPSLVVPMHVEGQPVWRQLGIALGLLFTRGIDVNPQALYADGPITRTAAPSASSASAPIASPPVAPRAAAAPTAATANTALALVLRDLAFVLGVDDADALSPDAGLFDLGLTSIAAVELAARLEDSFQVPLPDTIAFDCPTARALAQHLAKNHEPNEPDEPDDPHEPYEPNEPLALVGLSCRLPGGIASPDDFWQLLARGGDVVGRVPADRWDPAAFEHYIEPVDRPRALHGAFLDDIRGFDAAFFGISPREAVSLDPQQRLLLELVWEALEHAAIDPASLSGSRTGVFVGLSNSDYAQRLTPRERLAARGYLGTGNAQSTASGRLAFVLGLRGPAMTVDTACSSSLVALHLACSALRRGDADAALVAGVNVISNPETTVFLANGQALSPTGRCRTFDASADGYVRAEGGGVVVVKRLRDAEAAGDRILAIVRGTAVNHSGRTSGLTVPSGPAEHAVVAAALHDAGVSPDAVSYVEAHGTGTALGDPIEVLALSDIFRGRATRVPIGSVKTNVGHLEAAAGITGLIKIVLQLQHHQLAPSLHCDTPNPRIDWTRVPFDVVTSLREWTSDGPRIAGVSSFGISGTNAHAVIEEAPTRPRDAAARVRRAGPQVLPLSAPTSSALRHVAERLADQLASPSSAGDVPDGADGPDAADAADATLADIATTLSIGRRAFRYRHSFVVESMDDAREQLAAFARDTRATAPIGRDIPRVAFLFTGQGAQFAGMGAALEADEPVYRDALAQVAALVAEVAPPGTPSLLDVMHGTPAGAIDTTGWTQPALFAMEFALAQLWASRGVVPDAVIGHSVGEYVAAVVAGVMTLRDAVRLLWQRATLMQSLPAGGGMLAIRAAEADVAGLLTTLPRLSIAAINGPASVVVSGPVDDLAQLRAACVARQWSATPLTVSHAFHSSMMAPILDAFAATAASITYASPRVPIVSNLTGRLATHDGTELRTAEYWTRQLREPVRFADGLRTLIDSGITIALELGPRPVLTGLGQALGVPQPVHWVTSLMPGVDDHTQLAHATAALADAGVTIHWPGVHALDGARRVSLPLYPFERTPYWIRATLTTLAPGAGEQARRAGLWLGTRTSQPADGQTVRFETELYLNATEDLVDGRVLGRAIVPMSAFITMAARLSRALGLGDVCQVTAMTLPVPLVVSALGLTVQTVATPHDDGWRVRVFSRSPETDWEEHGAFTLAGGAAVPGTAPTTTADATRADGVGANAAAVTTLDGAEFYRRSARFGVEYAPRTQVLTRLSLSADRCDTRADAEATDDAVPLTVVDAAFQSLSAACFASTGRAVLGIRSVDAVRVHARLTGATAQTDIRVVARDTTWTRADITIRDRRSGHAVADILGVVCEYADVTERAAGPVADAAPVPPAGEITVAEVSRYLQRTISAILRLPAGTAIDTTALFSEMGFDSLMAMYLSTLIEQRWAITVTVSRMLECGHVDALSAAIVQQRAAPEAASSHGPQFVEGEL